MPRLRLAPIATLLAAALVGCGSSRSSSSSPAPPSPGATTAAGAGGALSAETQSAASGDIPDNQVYLRFRDPAAGYSILYPEGWTRKGGGGEVTFADKSNIIHIIVAPGAAPTATSVAAELARLKRARPGLAYTPPRAVQLKGGPAVKATYTTRSAPNPVTGKVVVLAVDRYVLGHAGKVAIVDLARPRGVDTVDAYRMISNSFRWR